jgi:hypothetical protein
MEGGVNVLVKRRGVGDIPLIDPSLISSLGPLPSSGTVVDTSTPDAGGSQYPVEDFPFTGQAGADFKRCYEATKGSGIYCAAQVAAAYASAPAASGGLPSWLLPAGIAAVLGVMLLQGGGRRR